MGLVEEQICESIETKQKILGDKRLLGQIKAAACLVQESLGRGGKVLFCGNGGYTSRSCAYVCIDPAQVKRIKGHRPY